MNIIKPIIAIGIDSADINLIQKWVNEGQLPTLSFLISNGSFGKLSSTADMGSATVWPSFFTGTSPAKHCSLGKPQLKSGSYDITYESYIADKLKREPFWYNLSKAGKRVAVLDIPGTYAPKELNGIHLSAWGAHGSFWYQDSYPPELIKEVKSLFGKYSHHCTNVVSHYNDHNYMSAFCTDLISNVSKKGSLSRHYLNKEDWDLFITVFSETHCAGHNLWHLMDKNHPFYDPVMSRSMGDTVLDVYKLIDMEIGKLLKSKEDHTYIIFSPEGMGPNYTGSHLLPDILRELGMVVHHDQSMSSRPSYNIKNQLKTIAQKLLQFTPSSRWGPNAVRKLRSTLPEQLVAMVDIFKRSVPEKIWNQWKSYLLTIGNDWKCSRAFCLPSDLNGAIRINLKGREPFGIVDPGPMYDDLCKELTNEFMQLINIDTGKKAVNRVILVNKEYEGENIDGLPDLVVKWSSDAPIRGLKSPRIGTVIGDNPHDRVGGHTNKGFLIAAGKNITSGFNFQEANIMDIAPTILYLMGQPVPSDMDGKVIMEIIDHDQSNQ